MHIRDEYFSSVEKSVDLGTFFPHNSTVDLGALGQKYPKKYPKVADLRVAGSKPKKIPEKMCTLPEIGNFTRKMGNFTVEKSVDLGNFTVYLGS